MRPLALAALTATAFTIAGCMEGGDPAEGGFISGVSGIASGSYDARIDEREAEVAAAEARNAELARQQQSLAAQIGAAEAQLARERRTLSQLRSSTAGMDAATRARVDEVLARKPAGRTDAERLASLQRTIADARKLSAELSRL